MIIGSEWLFRKFCRDPGDDTSYYDEGATMETALDLLRREVPDFDALVAGRTCLDFGCGYGYQAIALVTQAGAARAVGVDIIEGYVARARERAAEHGVSTQVEFFCPRLPAELMGSFDIVISQNSFEHYAEPEAILEQMLACAKPGGIVVVTFGPLWYAPYGGHGRFMTWLPWYHLIFKEETIMRVRADYRSDGATRFEEVEGGLNRMSVRKFESILREVCRRHSCQVDYLRYRTIKGLPIVAGLPLLRELFISRATCIIRKDVS